MERWLYALPRARQGCCPGLETAGHLYAELDFQLKSADFHVWHVFLRDDLELVTQRETQRKN